MDKKRLSKILVRAPREKVLALAEEICRNHQVMVLKKPEKTMVMLKVRESVKKTEFFLGEMLACHCMVEIEGSQGAAVMAYDDFDKARAAAVIDACHTGRLLEWQEIRPRLLELELEWEAKSKKEAALHRNTKVDFDILA